MGDDADLAALGLEDRPLLDVILEHRMHLAGTDLFVADPADAFKFRAELLAVEVGPGLGIVLGMNAREDAGRQHGGREARPFLVRPVGDDHRMFRPDPEVVHRAHHLKPGQHPQNPVELAAGGLGVEVRADVDRQCFGVGARTCREHVAHRVDAQRAARRLAPASEQMPPFAVRVGQGLPVVAARDPRPDPGHLHQAVPQACGIDAKIIAKRRHRHTPHRPVRDLHAPCGDSLPDHMVSFESIIT